MEGHEATPSYTQGSVVCRARPTTSSPGDPDSLGAEVVGCQAGIVYLQHQAGIVDGGRQDLGEMMGSVRSTLTALGRPCKTPLAALLRVGQSEERSLWSSLRTLLGAHRVVGARCPGTGNRDARREIHMYPSTTRGSLPTLPETCSLFLN